MVYYIHDVIGRNADDNLKRNGGLHTRCDCVWKEDEFVLVCGLGVCCSL